MTILEDTSTELCVQTEYCTSTFFFFPDEDETVINPRVRLSKAIMILKPSVGVGSAITDDLYRHLNQLYEERYGGRYE